MSKKIGLGVMFCGLMVLGGDVGAQEAGAIDRMARGLPVIGGAYSYLFPTEEQRPDIYTRFSGNLAYNFFYFDQVDDTGTPAAKIHRVTFQPEYYREWDDGDTALSFIPYFRATEKDNTSSAQDIRELNLLFVRDSWSVRVGWDRVFWGVTESQNLVDVINQTDLAGDLGGEQKLGQPMVRLDIFKSFGEFSFFVLPYFRERTFPDADSSLGSFPSIDEGAAVFESSREENHVDVAVRWSHSFNEWDIALSYFRGTNRIPGLNASQISEGEFIFFPTYNIIDQVGVELQYTKGSWLGKLEAIYQEGGTGGFGDTTEDGFFAFTTGVEYAFSSVFGTRWDVSAVAEYNWHELEEASIFANDVFFGLRVALNDVNSTEFNMGVIVDVDGEGTFYSADTSRRFFEKYRISLQVRVFDDVPGGEEFGISQLDFVQFQFARFF